MSGDPRPIGVFDSGLGGLTVVRALRRVLPDEAIVYFGDTARVPYGPKSAETVIRFSRENVEFLKGYDVKAVVVACHTASAVALDALRNGAGPGAAIHGPHGDLPLLGVVAPGARAAARATRNGRIGVIGTATTVESGTYQRALTHRDVLAGARVPSRASDPAPAVRVFARACPLFVSLAEEGWTDGDVPARVAQTYLQPLVDEGIDTLLLGCTHFGLLDGVIARAAGPAVTLVDPGEETAAETAELLADRGLLRSAEAGPPELRFFVSDRPAWSGKIASRFLGAPVEPLWKEI